MENVCTTEKELSSAVKNKEDEIIIEGDLAKKVFLIKATGKAAWAVCAVSLVVAITAIHAASAAAIVLPPAGLSSVAASFVMATPAAVILGPAAASAVVLGVCAGGVGVLNTIRDKYRIAEKGEKYLKLKRK